ncbi:MAG: hypothetical protein ACREDE_06285, partial [Thermoplasmata archaeon]
MPRPRPSSRRRGFAPTEALARLRRRSTGKEPFALYRIALELPRGAIGSAVSRAHPALRIEIENRLQLGPDLLLLETRVYGPGADSLREEMRALPGVVDVELRATGREVATYRLTIGMPLVQKVIQHHRILARYPITIHDGWMRFETLARASQVRALLADVTRQWGPNRVEAVRRGPTIERGVGLTPSQDALFRTALRAGYFGAPRGITVS